MQYGKSLASALQELSLVLKKIQLWQENWVQVHHSMNFRHFRNIS